jgi:hypothetical protein
MAIDEQPWRSELRNYRVSTVLATPLCHGTPGPIVLAAAQTK